MSLYGRLSRWAAALALGLAGLIGVGAALVLPAPARTAASAFELTLEGSQTLSFDDEVGLFDSRGTFRSRAPFCATGTFVDEWGTLRFTCDDGTGGLTVSIAQGFPPVPSLMPWGDTTWRVLWGSGSYAGLHGRGSGRGELLGREISPAGSLVTWRSTFEGAVDRDEVAPTITLSSATATKLRRPAGAYALKLGIGLRDDVADNPVSYTLRASAGGHELARRFGTAGTEAVSMTLLIRPPAGARTVWLQLNAEDPVGNTIFIRRALRLPR